MPALPALPALLAATALLTAVFSLARLPAAFLLGAMVAGMILSARGTSLRMPAWLMPMAQAVIGCLIARSFTPPLFRTIAGNAGLFAAASLSVLLVAVSLGLVLTRLRILPGSTLLWGSFPGAAPAMVLLSEAHGADMRLVAVMQYLRVVVVASTASLVARLSGAAGAAAGHGDRLAPVSWTSLATVLALVVAGGLVGPRLRTPAAAMLLPMAIAAVLQGAGVLQVELPQPLLAASYLVIGWTVGLRFTRDSFRAAGRALPRVLAAIAVLVAACAGLGWGLARLAHLDLLTGYLATSPGGADSVAIIAAATRVDAPLVMAIQTGRFLAVLLIGPALARYAARFAEGGGGSRGAA